MFLCGTLYFAVKTGLEIRAEYYRLGTWGFALLNFLYFVVFTCVTIFISGLFTLKRVQGQTAPINASAPNRRSSERHLLLSGLLAMPKPPSAEVQTPSGPLGGKAVSPRLIQPGSPPSPRPSPSLGRREIRLAAFAFVGHPWRHAFRILRPSQGIQQV